MKAILMTLFNAGALLFLMMAYAIKPCRRLELLVLSFCK